MLNFVLFELFVGGGAIENGVRGSWYRCLEVFARAVGFLFAERFGLR